MSALNIITPAKTTTHSPTTQSQGPLLFIIELWGLVVLTLHLAASSLSPEITWSLWPYTLLPNWLGWILALLTGALIIPPVNQGIVRSAYYVVRVMPHHALRTTHYEIPATLQVPHSTLYIAIALLSGLLFWLARLRHLRWGDGYLLSVALSYPNLDLRVIYNWQAPFTVFLHQRLWQFVANPLLGWPVENVYAAVSIGCGMIFVYGLLRFTHRLGRNPTERVILAGLLLTTGAMQLFFGYVENYTIVALLLLVTLFLSWRALQGELQPVWPVLGLSMANAFHPSTIFIWPGMLLLSYLCWKRNYISANLMVRKPAPIVNRKSKIVNALGQTFVPPLLIGGSVLLLMESGGHGLSAFLGVDRPGGGDGIWFVPLFETTTQWQHYTMFSVGHGLDWANLHLLISPFGLPLLVMIGLAAYRFGLVLLPNQPDRDFALFLGTTAGLYILFTWLWNADYGLQKDWDLFAPSAFVYTLLAGYLLVRALPRRDALQQAGLFMLAVSLLHTAAWIFANTHPLPRN